MKFDKSSVICEFKWKIHNFTPDNCAIYENTFIDTKYFSVFLGDKEKKWKFDLGIGKDDIEIRMKDKSETRDFRARFYATVDAKVKKDYHDECMTAFFEEHSSKLEHPRCGIFVGSIYDIFQDPENFLDNNTLTIYFKMELIDGFKRHPNECNCTASDLVTNDHFLELYRSKFLSDFTIVCSDGTELQTHRFILAANSPVFRAMLENPMLESINSRMKIGDIDGDTMDYILRLMYNPYEYIEFSKAKDMFYGLEKYQIQHLKDRCITTMIETFTDHDILDYFILAEFYNQNYLMQRCLMYIKPNYNVLHVTENWKKLNDKQLAIIDEYPYDASIEYYETTL